MLRRFMRFTTSPRWMVSITNFRSINNTRSVGQLTKLEEKKLEKLKSVREAVVDFYEKQKSDTLDLQKLKTFLADNGLNYKSNFEFVLLSAFDLSIENEGETSLQLDRNLFNSVANLVHSSPAVLNNKMAAVRFSVFLSRFRDYLTEEQCQFIKQTAMAIAKEGMKVVSIRQDIGNALIKSSAENCHFALEFLPRFIDVNDKRDFSLKVNLLNELAINSIHFGLLDQFFSLVRDHGEHLNLSSDQLGALINELASKTSRELSRVDLVHYFKLLSHIHTSLPLSSKPQVLKLLATRLKYNINDNVAITKKGVCSCCGTKLDALSPKEYNQLRENFRSIIFDRHEELLMKNLKEFEEQLTRFEMLIKLDENTTKPKFDLIIDALNLSYKRQTSLRPDPHGLRNFSKFHKVKDIDSQLIQLLTSSKVLTNYQRILLIGRDHMRNWPKLNQLLAKSRNIWAQFLKNRTLDDNYLLLAAIQHPDSFILSGDFFRNHTEKFNLWYQSDTADVNRPNLPQFFTRWLHSRQIFVEMNGRIMEPNQFDARIHFHQLDKAFRLHIPIVVEIDEVHKEYHKMEWICAHP